MEIEVRIESRVAILSMCQPDRLNAWDMKGQRSLREAVLALAADGDVDALVITGKGERAFCAGQDLSESAQFSSADVEGWLDNFALLYDAVLSTPKPVVAALNGVAAGSGYQLALLCDFRVAHPGVHLGQPEVSSGIPSITGLFLTWESLGHARTADLMLSGRMLTAEEAHDLGLLQRIVEATRVLPVSIEVALALASQPQTAFRITKRRLRDRLWPGIEEAFAVARVVDQEAWATGEPGEVARRFLSRRVRAERVDGS